MVSHLHLDAQPPDVLDMACSPCDPSFLTSTATSAPHPQGRLSLWNMRAFKRWAPLVPCCPVEQPLTHRLHKPCALVPPVGKRVCCKRLWREGLVRSAHCGEHASWVILGQGAHLPSGGRPAHPLHLLQPRRAEPGDGRPGRRRAPLRRKRPGANPGLAGAPQLISRTLRIVCPAKSLYITFRCRCCRCMSRALPETR